MRDFLAKAVEGVEGGAAVAAGGEEDHVGGVRLSSKKRWIGAVGVAQNQHAVAVLFEQLAEHVLHLDVGFDDHELARLALFVEAFATGKFLAGGAAFFPLLQSFDGELEVDEHVGRAFGSACRVRFRVLC